MKVLFVANDLDFFISHRLPLAKKAVELGYSVFIISNKLPSMKYKGIDFKTFSIERSSTSMLKNFKSLMELKKIIKDISPDIIHSITLKSILLSNLVLLFDKKVKKVNAVSGMGYLFTSNRVSFALYGLKFILRAIIILGNPHFIFQNLDDLKEFKKLGLKESYSIVNGSGVNKDEFDYSAPRTNKKINITFTGRILKDKGVIDLIKAIELLPENVKSKIIVNLFGKIDKENPAHIGEKQLNQLLIADLILWHGHSDDVKKSLINSDIYCLPSYREGLPKSTIEAMAIGRPIITTTAPGCDDTVEDGLNGYKVKAGDIQGLSKKIQELVENQQLRTQMGENSRELFLKKFTLEKVVSQTFDLYEKVLKT
tara:strand:+ start:222 stop:1328 length:1107 start_codon:yes stop_codon:yes gene_type:complete